MAVIMKCKMCGGDLHVEHGKPIATCEYCGTTQTIPSQDSEKKLMLFERANRLRLQCEFDKAESVYESIVPDFPTEAEAYWGMVLCRYGIEYVDDPKNGKKIPTCHRTSFTSVLEDKNFEQVMETADPIARKFYREGAKQIEELRKSIIEISGKEKPYDVFICYKETDERGERTRDSVMAQEVYDALTAKGYHVFFSRITLEDKLGQAYEPYIFAALNSARVMLVFGTSYDNFNATWVHNEWGRYLKIMERDSGHHLIPCYAEIDAYDIPKEFQKLQGQDMSKLGAVQDLMRGVEKLLGKTPEAAGGMTKEEKSHVVSLEKGQKRTKALLFGVLYAAVLAAAAFFLAALNEDGFFDVMFSRADGRIITFTKSPALLLPLVIYSLLGIGPALNTAYGIKNEGAHWIYLILYQIGAVIFIFAGTRGLRPGFLLVIPQVVNGIAAILTTFVLYRWKKASLIIRLLAVIVPAVLAILF